MGGFKDILRIEMLEKDTLQLKPPNLKTKSLGPVQKKHQKVHIEPVFIGGWNRSFTKFWVPCELSFFTKNDGYLYSLISRFFHLNTYHVIKHKSAEERGTLYIAYRPYHAT
jgi:hypothetical protein